MAILAIVSTKDYQLPACRSSGQNWPKFFVSPYPIVFVSGDDPIKSGLVMSLNRPGGTVTGAAMLTGQLGAKQLGLLRELAPNAALVAVIVNPNNPFTEGVIKDIRAAATLIGHQI